MDKKQVIYYNDELNDEFSGSNITPRSIDDSYVYIHRNPFWNMASFILQNILSVPIKILYSKIKFKIKYVGKENIKKCKDTGFFIYANHTQVFADTFIPSIPIYPKRNFFIVNPENVSMKIKKPIEMLGAIPIPNSRSGMKNFLDAIKDKIEKNQAITIYPEAHIWPYYTKIRPFKDVSFKYPVKLGKPAFCMTNTYQKCGNNKVKIVTYIDGPFYPDINLSIKESQKKLRDEIYNTMSKRSANSNVEVIKYVKNSKSIAKK